MIRTRLATAAGGSALALALLLAGCGSSTPQDSHKTDASGQNGSSSAPVRKGSTGAASPSPTAPLTPPTCDALIGDSLATKFAAQNWTSKPQPFVIAQHTVDGGVTCAWGDFRTAGGNVQLYGWAPISQADATKYEDELIASGWRREDSSDGVYVTEDPDSALNLDSKGYGQTYLFGDGWVTMSDTKQGLLLIQRPQ